MNTIDRAWSLLISQFQNELEAETRLIIFRFLKRPRDGMNCEMRFEEDVESYVKKYNKQTVYDPNIHTVVLVQIPKGENRIEEGLRLYTRESRSISEKVLETGSTVRRRWIS